MMNLFEEWERYDPSNTKRSVKGSSGSVTRFRAKRFKEAFNGLI
jgi:hypothetical protein